MSFFLEPASKFKDPGLMIEEFAPLQGVCTSAEESDRFGGVLSFYLPCSSDSAEKALEHSRAGWILGARRAGRCSLCGEFGACGFSMLHLFQSKAWTSPLGWDKGEAWGSFSVQKTHRSWRGGRLATGIEPDIQISNIHFITARGLRGLALEPVLPHLICRSIIYKLWVLNKVLNP